jgi:transposase
VLRQKLAIELKLQGYSIREIAEKLGVTKSQAHRDLQDILAHTKEEALELAEQARKVALEQIDVAIKGLFKRIKKGDTSAVFAFTRLDERRAKLLHLEKTKIEHTGPAGAPLAADERGALIAELRAIASRSAGAATGSGAASGNRPPEAEAAPGTAT